MTRSRASGIVYITKVNNWATNWRPGWNQTNKNRGQTLRAPIICSGAIVFFESCSQISFASEEMRCMNSRKRPSERTRPQGSMEREGKVIINFYKKRVPRYVWRRTDTAFNDQVACLFGTRDVVREEFCMSCVMCCVHVHVFIAWI
jgi:hypothetical protein